MALELVNKLPYDHPYRWDGTLFGGPKLWRPDELGASLALWLDAADSSTITLNGSTVSQWDDKSSNGNNAVQASASNQPLYDSVGMDGKPALVWPNAVNGKFISTQNQLVIYQTFIVTRFADGLVSSPYASVHGLFAVNTSAGLNLGTNWYVNQYNNARVNGGVLETLPNPALPLSKRLLNNVRLTMPVAETLNLGWASAGRGWSGPIGEVLVFEDEIPESDRQKLEGYLAWKWGLEANLPSDHPYKSTPPTV